MERGLLKEQSLSNYTLMNMNTLPEQDHHATDKRIYVGSIPGFIDVSQLMKYFKRFGYIKRIRMFYKNDASRMNRGYCHVVAKDWKTYETILNFKNHNIDNRHIFCLPYISGRKLTRHNAINNMRRIIVRGLPEVFTSESLKTAFEVYGEVEISYIFAPHALSGKGHPTQLTGSIQFSSRSVAESLAGKFKVQVTHQGHQYQVFVYPYIHKYSEFKEKQLTPVPHQKISKDRNAEDGDQSQAENSADYFAQEAMDRFEFLKAKILPAIHKSKPTRVHYFRLNTALAVYLRHTPKLESNYDFKQRSHPLADFRAHPTIEDKTTLSGNQNTRGLSVENRTLNPDACAPAKQDSHSGPHRITENEMNRSSSKFGLYMSSSAISQQEDLLSSSEQDSRIKKKTLDLKQSLVESSASEQVHSPDTRGRKLTSSLHKIPCPLRGT